LTPILEAPSSVTALSFGLRNQKQTRTNMADMGLYGLGVMGQNLALNVCEKGFNISVANRSEAKVDTCVARYEKEILGDEALAADAC